MFNLNYEFILLLINERINYSSFLIFQRVPIKILWTQEKFKKNSRKIEKKFKKIQEQFKKI
jgi:hypothetical protein